MTIVCTHVSGNFTDFAQENRLADFITMEWFEAYKRVGRYKSNYGLDCIIKFDKILTNGFCDGDVIYIDSERFVYIVIQSTPCLQIKTQGLLETAKLCYEIGNFHIPLFLFDQGEFYIPYERTIQRILKKLGFCTIECEAKLDTKYRLHTLNNEVIQNVTGTNTPPPNYLEQDLTGSNQNVSTVQVSRDFKVSFSKKQK